MLNQGQFVDSYDPTIENTFNKSIKIRNQVRSALSIASCYSIFLHHDTLTGSLLISMHLLPLLLPPTPCPLPFHLLSFQEFELHVVDTAGQDEYSIFPTQYSVDIHGYLLLLHLNFHLPLNLQRQLNLDLHLLQLVHLLLLLNLKMHLLILMNLHLHLHLHLLHPCARFHKRIVAHIYLDPCIQLFHKILLFHCI